MKHRLSDDDYLQILSCIEGIYRCRDLDKFPRGVLAELRKIIDCSLAGYNEVNLPRERIITVFDPPQPQIGPEQLAGFGQLMAQHPVISYFDRTGDGQTLKISDFLTVREYHRRDIYQQFFRALGAEDQISFGVQVGPGFIIGIAFNRSARSFTEKDRLRLNLIRPHVIQAYLHAAEVAGYREQQDDLRDALRHTGVGVIGLDRRGNVIHTTPGVFDCLARYLPIPKTSIDILPPQVAKWVREQGDHTVAAPYTIDQDFARLTIRLVPGKERTLLLFSEDNGDALRARLERYALTPREQEVLRWAAEGKANGEIATILSLTPGTVKVHVERALAKLGVDNRTAAALIVHGVH